VVGRLILFHRPDAVEVLHHHVGGLTEDGLILMIDFDVGSVRSEPAGPHSDTVRDWRSPIEAAAAHNAPSLSLRKRPPPARKGPR
jgi:hypothetical protein